MGDVIQITEHNPHLDLFAWGFLAFVLWMLVFLYHVYHHPKGHLGRFSLYAFGVALPVFAVCTAISFAINPMEEVILQEGAIILRYHRGNEQSIQQSEVAYLRESKRLRGEVYTLRIETHGGETYSLRFGSRARRDQAAQTMASHLGLTKTSPTSPYWR